MERGEFSEQACWEFTFESTVYRTGNVSHRNPGSLPPGQSWGATDYSLVWLRDVVSVCLAPGSFQMGHQAKDERGVESAVAGSYDIGCATERDLKDSPP